MYNILLNNGKLFSDGSSNGGRATYAVVVQPPEFDCPLSQVNYESFVHFSGKVEGSDDDIHSYRAELAGILAAIEYTNTICLKFGIVKGKCTLYCDNKGALAASFGHKRPTPRWTSYDLVHQHIKGHQDSSSDFSKLSYPAQGNVLADHFATRAYEDDDTQYTKQIPYPWRLEINNKYVSGDISRRLKTEIFRPIMTQRWATIFGLITDQYILCDWQTYL